MKRILEALIYFYLREERPFISFFILKYPGTFWNQLIVKKGSVIVFKKIDRKLSSKVEFQVFSFRNNYDHKF